METLHSFLYNLLTGICFDREYLYKSYVNTFNKLTEQIYNNNGLQDGGTVKVSGLKSDFESTLTWNRTNGLNYYRLCEITLCCEVVNKLSNQIVDKSYFLVDLTTGLLTRQTEENGYADIINTERKVTG